MSEDKVNTSETKIKLVEDAEATGLVAEVYDEWRKKSGRKEVPGILKCFSARPDFLRQVMAFSDTVHFSEGHLTRRHKEMIATYVSALNHCPY
ncbi:MAG: hypothetical protein JWO20_2147 [Candidatus Angelobacter sp.]|nr:hypothetical protein [Candidatus Angelobacter sp.]